MSAEAFIWNYENNAPAGFDFDTVRDILVSEECDWDSELGRLRVTFRNPDDSVDIFLGRQAPATNHIDGILI